MAQNQEFRDLGREIAMQVSAMNPADVKELLDQEFIRDASQTIGKLIKSLSGKIGEKIEVSRFARFAIGDEQK